MLYKIEEAAQTTGLTKRAIRYYEQIGLISAPERTEKGTRVYDDQDIERLQNVVTAKEVLGFSLQELQQYLDLKEQVKTVYSHYQSVQETTMQHEDLKQISDSLQAQIDMLDQKINQMTTFKMEMENLKKQADNVLSSFNKEK